MLQCKQIGPLKKKDPSGRGIFGCSWSEFVHQSNFWFEETRTNCTIFRFEKFPQKSGGFWIFGKNLYQFLSQKTKRLGDLLQVSGEMFVCEKLE